MMEWQVWECKTYCTYIILQGLNCIMRKIHLDALSEDLYFFPHRTLSTRHFLALRHMNVFVLLENNCENMSRRSQGLPD